MTLLAWFILAFLAGSLPFSVWIGALALRTDIRRHGDGNPGAANVLRSGSKLWGGVALLLDSLKGAIPVGLAFFGAGLAGWPLVTVALAPVAGHAFSPFLRFRGGKAVAVTFGIWSGLTLWQAPTALGLLLATWFALVANSGWAVLLAMLSLLIYLGLAGAEPVLLAVWLGNSLVLAWKHRSELARRPEWRPWLRKLVAVAPGNHSPVKDNPRT